ncbi:MAG: cyclic nucleotide-binding domain-containing protein [Desulfobacteraceae bacterium]|nr:cyclic nucleotide-binding domain-containing protein [Desulfobacteraceae bacterium]MBC2756511.1 cyclic nucleotide-binding domain-containing protein [Desulfobacteraceae bacterium]
MMSSNIVLKGSLSYLSLGELLQLFGGSGSTGILKLTSMHTEGPGFIYLIDGNPVDAEYQNQKGQDVLNSFFGWMDAQFEFSDEKILHRKTIQKNRMEIILDGLRMLDDGLIKKIGQTTPKKSKAEIKDESGIPIIKGPLVDYLYIVDEDGFSDGQEIVVQEKFGNWLWVILEGTVEVVRLLPEGQVVISKLAEGAFIGSISSLKEKSNVRSATVTAVGDVQLGVLDYHRILEEFSKLSENLNNVLYSIEQRLIQVTAICANSLVKKIKIHKNMGELKELNFSEKTDDRILKIISGEAVVVKQINNRFVQLCLLKTDDVLGNIPFLGTSHEPHSATVFVSDNFQTEEINLIDLKEEYDELSTTLKNMILHTSTCLSVTTGRLIDVLKNFKGK